MPIGVYTCVSLYYHIVYHNVNHYPADNDYCRFKSVLLVDQITFIGNEMSV